MCQRSRWRWKLLQQQTRILLSGASLAVTTIGAVEVLRGEVPVPDEDDPQPIRIKKPARPRIATALAEIVLPIFMTFSFVAAIADKVPRSGTKKYCSLCIGQDEENLRDFLV